MSFNQLIINIDSKSADKLSDIFFSLNALSVSIEDQYEGTPLEQAIFDEPGIIIDELWEYSKVIVLLDKQIDLTDLISNAVNMLGQDFTYTVEHVEDQDWVRQTQSQFKPIKINNTFYIVPSWHELPDKRAKSIILDPGVAFGTGSHPTTFMCLEWLASNVSPAIHSVLDYGCGSGILAISAKIHGAQNVHGVDIDPQAIEASIANANNNSVAIQFTLPDKLEAQSYDIVVANILSNPLRLLAPALASLTKTKLILSGILHSQSSELAEIYQQWFNVREANINDGWVLLECSK